MTKSTGNVFEHNWYLGQYASLPGDTEGKTMSEVYQEWVLDRGVSGYEGLWQLMDERSLFGTPCRFVNKEKIEDFFLKMDQ